MLHRGYRVLNSEALQNVKRSSELIPCNDDSHSYCDSIIYRTAILQQGTINDL